MLFFLQLSGAENENFPLTNYPEVYIAKLSLNSTSNFEAEIALFPAIQATHPPSHPPTHRESSKIEQDFKYFNWRL